MTCLKKYNIVFLPQNKSAEFIQKAALLTSLRYRYQLGEASHPHVTLCQFHMDENKVAGVWQDCIKTLPVSRLTLSFGTYQCAPHHGKFWISLMPDHRDLLFELHAKVANLVGLKRRTDYDPHLTLINTLDEKYAEKTSVLLKDYQLITDDFVLAIGDCDEIGQVTRVIETLSS